MDVKIEDGIPIPPPCSGRSPKYPVNMLSVGQSFLVPISEPQNKKDMYQNNIGSHIHKTAKRYNMKVIVRGVPEGLRVWRVE